MIYFPVFSLGCVFASLTVAFFMWLSTPQIKNEDLYRFCLVKNIPLEECKTPLWPAKKGAGHEQ
ncbi:hypothetical protein PX52LOC_03737 [Limnoglobus roseus]|uniref:Uncharacterized protein n=1 Tax=Limnoglobus roseus TaxID=2598579 RepID=A0A5C1AIH3_9BACT|nr:hypothetical protein PX52LOC_03737 [Limnoglobus roseus]